ALLARARVQVDGGVDPVPGEMADRAVKPPETLLAEPVGLGVREEVSIVDRDTHAVHAERGDVLGVFLGEEDLEEAVEECVVHVPAEHLSHCPTMHVLSAGVSGDEILHVHPAAETESCEPDRLAVTIDEAGSRYSQ